MTNYLNNCKSRFTSYSTCVNQQKRSTIETDCFPLKTKINPNYIYIYLCIYQFVPHREQDKETMAAYCEK